MANNYIYLFIYFYFILKKFWGGEEKVKTKEDQRMVKLDFISLQKCVFRHILKKSTYSLIDAWSFHSVHIQFTPSEGPKGFVK